MARRPPLSTTVAQELARKIEDGTLKPGEKLPTEAELCEKFEVSRTVVREAVARLRSDGLLIPRQGIGVFVSSAPSIPRFELNEVELQTLREIIELLELRLSVEVESAGLCAVRRTDEEAAEIRNRMEAVEHERTDSDTVSAHYDYDFHLTIAKATRNSHIFKFMEFLKPSIVPRFQLNNLVDEDHKDAFYLEIQEEHEAIVSAIEARDDECARWTMRKHLLNSLERFKGLAHSLGLSEVEGTKAGDSPIIQQLVDGISAPKKRRDGML